MSCLIATADRIYFEHCSNHTPCFTVPIHGCPREKHCVISTVPNLIDNNARERKKKQHRTNCWVECQRLSFIVSTKSVNEKFFLFFFIRYRCSSVAFTWRDKYKIRSALFNTSLSPPPPFHIDSSMMPYFDVLEIGNSWFLPILSIVSNLEFGVGGNHFRLGYLIAPHYCTTHFTYQLQYTSRILITVEGWSLSKSCKHSPSYACHSFRLT